VVTPADGSAPRPLRLAAIFAACLLLTALLVLRGFPYDLLARRLASEVEGATGTRVAVGALEPRLTLGGPGFEASGVRIQTADGTRVQIDRAALRPAWSLAWLRLSPAVHADLESVPGNLSGVFVLGRSPGFSGRVEAVDLARLPLAGLWPGLELSGVLDADVDLSTADGTPRGSVVLHAEQGTLRTPELPIALPFETLDGELRFGDEHLVEVSRLEAAGPMFSAQVSGTVDRADSAAGAPLDLVVSYEVEPQMRATLEGAGLPTRRDGSGRVHIQGTTAQPRLQ
jgi:type II secretion system protein N